MAPEAVAVLNRHRHRGIHDWRDVEGLGVTGTEPGNDPNPIRHHLDAFEAAAVAERYLWPELTLNGKVPGADMDVIIDTAYLLAEFCLDDVSRNTKVVGRRRDQSPVFAVVCVTGDRVEEFLRFLEPLEAKWNRDEARPVTADGTDPAGQSKLTN